MKKTVELTVMREERQTVELEFPLYREHDAGDGHTWTIYSRIESDGSGFSIRESCCPTSFEIEIDGPGFAKSSDPDYTFARGIYKSDAATFYGKLAEVRALLDRIPPQSSEQPK